MGKRLLSLCMVLILCLTLLPATALAAENAPTTLYVGNYQITNGNATTYLKAGSTQGSLVEGSENGRRSRETTIFHQFLMAPGSMLSATAVNQLP